MDTNGGQERNKALWKIVTILILSALLVPALIYTLKGWGVLIAIVGAIAYFIAVTNRGVESQLAPLRRSVELSLEDIRTVLDQWNTFQFSPDQDALADRTFNYRELLNLQTDVESIAAFHHMVPVAEQVVASVESRYPQARSTRELTSMLTAADQVSEELAELWARARQDARHQDS